MAWATEDMDQGTLIALAVERERLDTQIRAMGEELDARRRDGEEMVRAVARLRAALLALNFDRGGEMMSEPLVVVEGATDYLTALAEWLAASAGANNERAQ